MIWMLKAHDCDILLNGLILFWDLWIHYILGYVFFSNTEVVFLTRLLYVEATEIILRQASVKWVKLSFLYSPWFTQISLTTTSQSGFLDPMCDWCFRTYMRIWVFRNYTVVGNWGVYRTYVCVCVWVLHHLCFWNLCELRFFVLMFESMFWELFHWFLI